MHKKKFSFAMIGLIIFFALIIGQVPAGAATTREQFDAADNRSLWQAGSTNDAGGLAWNRSYVMEAFLVMYRQTGDTHYLDRFVTHADDTLAQRDSVRRVTDYRGLSLPAWRAGGSYTINGQYYDFAVHTGMLSYPLADFADLVYRNNLTAYKAKADLYLKAAKDAVAVHADQWVESGDEGWYIDPKGAPLESDGIGLPHNQYMAIARAELAIYRAAGEQIYLNRATKMANHFKKSLILDTAKNAYTWYYWWGPGLNGWSQTDGLSKNTPSYSGYKAFEDVGHGYIDVSFAYLAYENGIVFTDVDMQRFGNTIEKNLIRTDGQVNKWVNSGGGISSPPATLGMWLVYSPYAPSLASLVEKDLSVISHDTYALLTLFDTAQLIRAEKSGAGSGGTLPGDNNTSPGGSESNGTSQLINGDFSAGRTGWSGTSGTVKQENGNGFVSNGYSWGFYQDVTVTQGKVYVLGGQTRRGTAATNARMVAYLLDAQNNIVQTYDVKYSHQGTGWENLPESKITVPSTARTLRVYLLTNGGTGTHDFDNIRLSNTAGDTPTVPADTTAPRVTTVAPADGASINSRDTFDVAFSEDVTGVNESTFFIEGIQGAVTYDSASRSAKLTPANPLPEGSTYQVRLEGGIADAAGNRLTPVVFSYQVPDRTVPQVAITNPVSGATVSGSIKLTASASDNVGVKTLVFQIAGGDGAWRQIGNGTAANNVWTLDWNVAGLQGEYNIMAIASDNAANEAKSTVVKISVMTRTQPAAGELVANGDFNENGSGWETSGGELVQEANGNKYARVGYNWHFYQDISVLGGAKYKLNVQTRKGTGSDAARLALSYADKNGVWTAGPSFTYNHKGTGWELLPSTEITIPAGSVKVRLFLLSNGSSKHDFDNLSMVKAADPVVQNPVQNNIINGDFNAGRTGWSGNGGTVKQENGNGYISANYSWQLYQNVAVVPGKNYILSGQTRRGTAQTEARLVAYLLDAQNNIVQTYEIKYVHNGTGWENIPGKNITIPSAAKTLRVYLLVNGGTGTHDFDNISLAGV